MTVYKALRSASEAKFSKTEVLRDFRWRIGVTHIDSLNTKIYKSYATTPVMVDKKVTDAAKKKVHELRGRGLSKTATAMEVGICRQSVTQIENSTYDAHLQILSKQYRTPPLPLLDIIIREGTTTAGAITTALGYMSHTDSYVRALETLKQLYDDRILKRTGRGGKGHPYKYSLNQNHPRAYLLKAMCQPDDVLEAKCQSVRPKTASAQLG